MLEWMDVLKLSILFLIGGISLGIALGKVDL